VSMRIRRSGFTLVELVIVVLILSISTAIAAPRYLDALSNFRCDATARRVVADIRLARKQARKTSGNQSVVFDVSNNQIDMPNIADLDHRGQAYQFRLGQSEYQAVLVSANFAGSPTLTFDIYGRPESSGTVVVSVGDKLRSIFVDDSGHVTLP